MTPGKDPWHRSKFYSPYIFSLHNSYKKGGLDLPIKPEVKGEPYLYISFLLRFLSYVSKFQCAVISASVAHPTQHHSALHLQQWFANNLIPGVRISDYNAPSTLSSVYNVR